MSLFSIADQSVTLPDGSVLHFRTNAADSSLCELHIAGRSASHSGDPGTHVISFKRNGGPNDTQFIPTMVKPSTRDTIALGADGSHKDELNARMDAADGNKPLNLTDDPAKPLDKPDPRKLGVPGDPAATALAQGRPVPYGSQAALPPGSPLAAYPTVDDGAVRNPDGGYNLATPNPPGTEAFGAKVSPVHGRINTVGTDGLPVKPPEGNAPGTLKPSTPVG